MRKKNFSPFLTDEEIKNVLLSIKLFLTTIKTFVIMFINDTEVDFKMNGQLSGRAKVKKDLLRLFTEIPL